MDKPKKRKVTEKQMANLIKFTENTAREKGSKGGNKKKENEPKRKEEQLKKEAFKEVAQNALWDIQGLSLKQMSEWVKMKLEDVEILSNSELEKIQKFLEFLRDSSGQTPTQRVELDSSMQVQQGLDKINEYFESNTK
jgi:hypothetical protein